MRRRTGLWWTAIATSALLLAGCVPTGGGGGGDTTTDPTTPVPTPTVSESTDAPDVRVFQMPKKCADIITAETAAQFAREGRDLLGGPGGLYEGDYFPDETEEEQLGGITCIWGDEDDLASTVVVSVAPLNATTRSQVVAERIRRGLIESQIEGALTYSQIGDEESAQAIFNVIRSESWISVMEAVGGEARFRHATALVDEVTELVYVVR